MRVRLLLGDLREQPVDVVVRPTSAARLTRRDELLSAAGPDVLDACRELRRGVPRGGLAVGDALPTPAGQLPARWLVHVALPTYTVRSDHSHLLAAAYRAVLRAADDLDAQSVALTPFGTVAPYWPLAEAVRLCLGTLHASPTGVREVRLVLSSPGALEVFAEALARR